MSDADDETEPLSRKRAGLWARIVRTLRRDGDDPAAAVAEALREHENGGEQIEGAHRDMIIKAVRFDRLKVADVMRPRADIVGVEANATLGEAARIFSDSQHSRLPVYRESLDDPMGFVHVRDVMAMLAPDEEGGARAKFTDRLLARIKRDILFVPQSMKLSTLFLKMKSSRIHLALVIDEYGGTDGLVSMEDLVEQIVGEIDDEHDEEAALVQERPGGVYEADGRAPIEKLEVLLGQKLDVPEHEDEFDTAGGLVAALAGRVPQRGEILHHPAGFDLEIVDADPRRVKRVRIRPAPPAAAEPDEPAPKERARRA